MTALAHTIVVTADGVTLDGVPSTMEEAEAALVVEGWQYLQLGSFKLNVGDRMTFSRTVGIFDPRGRRPAPFWVRWWNKFADWAASWTI